MTAESLEQDIPTSTHSSIVMYWRPGCGFCAGLERQMNRAGLTFEKRNIWDEPSAAEFVRSVARGHETVPTVTIGETSFVNPSIEDVLSAIEEVSL